MKAILHIIVAVVCLIIIAGILFKCIGIGKGIKNPSKVNQPNNTQQTEESEKPRVVSEGEEGNIIIQIREDQVFVNNKEYKTEEELKKYIDSINDDGKTFELVEEQSILATHEWVEKVFQELDIALIHTNK